MANVTIEGIFMGANVKTSTFEGNSKSSLYIDLYQPESENNEKTVQLKADDVSLINDLSKRFQMGTKFKCTATVNAYKNKAYYKLQNII